jgi:hypothetical protein
MAKHIQAAVAPPDLEIAIISAVPLIDVLDYIDLPAVKVDAQELFDAALAYVGFYFDLHRAALHHLAIDLSPLPMQMAFIYGRLIYRVSRFTSVGVFSAMLRQARRHGGGLTIFSSRFACFDLDQCDTSTGDHANIRRTNGTESVAFTPPTERKSKREQIGEDAERQRLETALEEGLAETFPASDAAAVT